MSIVPYLQTNFLSFIICFIIYRHHKKKNIKIIDKRLFNIILISVCILVSMDSFSWMLEGNTFPGARFLYYAELNIHLIWQIIPCLCMFVYCMWIGNNKRIKLLSHIYFIPFFICVGLTIANCIHPYLFTLDENNVYHRGPYFYIMAIVPMGYLVLNMVMCIYNFIKADNENDQRTQLQLIIFIAMPFVGAAFQIFFYGVETIWMMVTAGIVYVYINVQSKREEEMQEQLEQSQIAMTLSQIQPHFLYNTIAGIQELCLQDVHKAHEALGKFARFLRGNMNSIMTTKLIPVDDEINHVSNYFYLQQLRYGDKIQLHLDIQEEELYVPALCIQPLVENAIRHGISRKQSGNVWVKTYSVESYSYIEVEDDGEGISNVKKKKEEGIQAYTYRDMQKYHVGIDNIRSRIQKQCNGELEIQDVEDGGTRIIIKLHKK